MSRIRQRSYARVPLTVWRKVRDDAGVAGVGPHWRQQHVGHAISRSLARMNGASGDLEVVRHDMWAEVQPEEGEHWIFFIAVGGKPL